MGTLNQKVGEAGQLFSGEILGFGVAPVMSDDDEQPVFSQELRKTTFLEETETPQFGK